MKKILLIILLSVLAITISSPMVMAQATYEYILPIYTGWFGIHTPTGSGNYIEWTNGYADIDDTWNNPDDNNYITTSADSANSSFVFSDWSGTATISSVQVIVRAKKIFTADDLELFYRTGGVDYNQGSLYPTGSYTDLSKISLLNPATGNAWTTTEVTAMEWGVKKLGVAGAVYVSQMYVKVIAETINGETFIATPPISIPLDTATMAANGFADADFLNTNMSNTSIGYALTSDTLYYNPTTISAGETKTSNLYLNYSPSRTSHNMTYGASSNISTLDDPLLEGGLTMNITYTGYFDTSTVGSHNTTNVAFGAGVAEQYSANLTIEGNYAISNEDQVITGIWLLSRRASGDTGTGYVSFWAANTTIAMAPGALSNDMMSETAFDLSLLPVGAAMANAGYAYIPINEFFIGAGTPFMVTTRRDGGVIPMIYYNVDVSNFARVASSVNGTYWDLSGGSAATEFIMQLVGYNPRMIVNKKDFAVYTKNNGQIEARLYASSGNVTLHGPISTGYHSIRYVYSNGGNSLLLDGATLQTTNLPVATDKIIDNTSNYLWMQYNQPASTWISLVTGITERFRYEGHTSLISGTTVTDLDGGDNNGTISFGGGNPSGITTWLGAMTSYTAYTGSAPDAVDTPPDMFAQLPASIIRTEEQANAKLKNVPGYFFFNEAAVSLGMKTADLIGYFTLCIGLAVSVFFGLTTWIVSESSRLAILLGVVISIMFILYGMDNYSISWMVGVPMILSLIGTMIIVITRD